MVCPPYPYSFSAQQRRQLCRDVVSVPSRPGAGLTVVVQIMLLGKRLTRAAAFAKLGAVHVRNARVCTMLDKETMTTQPLVLLTSDGYCCAK